MCCKDLNLVASTLNTQKPYFFSRFSSVKELEKSIPDIEKQLNLAKADHTKARAADEQVMEKVIG